LDGTLTDPKTGIVLSVIHALEKLGAPIPNEKKLSLAIGPPLRDSFADFLQTDDTFLIEKAITYYRQRYSEKGLYENTLYPHITQTLTQLTLDSHSLFVATSKPAHYAKIIIEHFDLQGFFKGVYGSEMDGRNSDKSALISTLMEREKLSRANTIMIGDRKFDMHGAKSNAIQAVGVLWGYGSRDELQNSGADQLCTSPMELTKVLKH
jgi:phosphoglycolate phosphatase